jgi:hypothetical protein
MDVYVLFTPQREKHIQDSFASENQWPAHLTTTSRKECHDDMVDIAD